MRYRVEMAELAVARVADMMGVRELGLSCLVVVRERGRDGEAGEGDVREGGARTRWCSARSRGPLRFSIRQRTQRQRTIATAQPSPLRTLPSPSLLTAVAPLYFLPHDLSCVSNAPCMFSVFSVFITTAL